ncbi:MAG: sulfotransferase [Phycisphaerales bacterium]
MLVLPADQMLKRAISALESGQLLFAEQAARSVVKAAPSMAAAWVALGRVLIATIRFEEATQVLDTAERLQPGNVDALLARGQMAWRLGRDEEVQAFAERVLKTRPQDHEATILLGASLRRMGKLDQALETLRRIQNTETGATYAAWTLLDMNDAQGAFNMVIPFAKRTNMAPSARCNLFHVLGQAQERLGRYSDAFRSYTESKTSVKVNFGEVELRRGVALLKEIFTAEFLRNAPKPAVRTERPVFIAAMPRSGTTLLDRIIAAHPQGAGAGETRALRRQIAEWHTPDPETAWPRNVRKLGAADLDRIVVRYLEETNSFGPTALRIADKHLQNWVYVGLIAMAFPDARVIHLRRDPMDIGISCYERLEPVALPWSASLKHIGMSIRATEEMMAFWKDNAPIKILTVQYEDIVRNQQSETRRIIEFLGLPWDDACLAHHTAKRGDGGQKPAPTLSSEQAARPIKDDSIGRAAKFGALLDPLREALETPL